MEMRKHWFPIEAFCIMALLLSSACTKHEGGAEQMLLSDEEITVLLPDWSPMIQSRADLYRDNNDLLDPENGGGNITLYAHVDGTDNTYIHGTRVWYFDSPTIKRWIFLNSSGSPLTYYWPNSNRLNFFAFMPDSRYNGKDGYKSKETYVTIGDYTEAKGQTFSCNLPPRVGFIPETASGTNFGGISTTSSDSDLAVSSTKASDADLGGSSDTPSAEYAQNTDIQEFIYAYHEGLTKENNPVALQFKHPFAQIEFQLAAGSYRMSIDNIVVKNICLKGTFSTAESLNNANGWTPDESSRQAFTAEINRRIPNDINYTTPLGEPLLVLPQAGKITFTLNATRDADKDSPTQQRIQIESNEMSIDWEPGKKYIYTISVGDNNEEIYFNVKVQGDWSEALENNIDVE